MDSVGNIILYFVVAILMVVSSFLAIRTRKILRSATYLLFALLSTAIFYFQLGYQFLGAIQIAVYAGGIMVLFVFAILLTHRPDEKSKKLENHRKFVGIISAAAGAIVLLFALFYMPLPHDANLVTVLDGSAPITMQMIGEVFTGTGKFQYLLPFEAVSVLLLACIIGGVTIARKH